MRELVPHGGTSTARAKHVYDATILLFNLLLTQKLRDGVYKNIGSTERQGQWALQIIAVHKYIPSIYRYNSQGGESSATQGIIYVPGTVYTSMGWAIILAATFQATSHTTTAVHTCCSPVEARSIIHGKPRIHSEHTTAVHGTWTRRPKTCQRTMPAHGTWDLNMRKIKLLVVWVRRNGGHRISICALRNS